MAQTVEIMAGQSAVLPAGHYLDARLTGVAGGAQLRALAGDDKEVSQPRESDAEVSVRPDPEAGVHRLVAVPTGEAAFAPGVRLGVEFRAGAGDSGGGAHVLVGQIDVGAYTSVELARFEYVSHSGWHVTAAGGRAESAFDFLSDGRSDGAATALDERLHPWIGPGRYALREARSGSSSQRPSAEAWALVVDSSASMRRLFDYASLDAAVALLAGIVAELTGHLPMAAGLTGRRLPEWSPEAVEDPRLLAPSVLDSTQPASWSLMIPALEEATRKGASVVALLADGAPADLDALPGFVERHPGVTVLVAVGVQPAKDGGGSASALQLTSFDQVGRLPQVRLAALPLGFDATGAEAAAVAAALAGVTV